MQSILNKVRGRDLFAVPVSLTYKGKRRFNTLCGGCCSIFLLLSFTIYAVLDLFSLIVHPDLMGNVEKRYLSTVDNDYMYNITTQNSTLAVRIVEEVISMEEINKLMRVVFWRSNNGKLDFIPAVNCSDFFADKDDRAFFDDVFHPTTTQYVCPDTSEISVLNWDIVIIADIYPCIHAKSEGYSPAYGDQSCASYKETQESFNDNSVVIYSQQISQYFNPLTYQANGTLNYMSQNFRKMKLESNSTVWTQ